MTVMPVGEVQLLAALSQPEGAATTAPARLHIGAGVNGDGLASAAPELLLVASLQIARFAMHICCCDTAAASSS